MCNPGRSNDNIPPCNRIPGAPTRTSDCKWGNPAMKGNPIYEQNQELTSHLPDGRTQLNDVIVGAKSKVAAMAKELNKPVTIKFTRNRRFVVDDGFVPVAPSNIVIPVPAPPKKK